MPFVANRAFFFDCAALPATTLDVISFHGVEGISRPYCYTLELASTEEAIPLDDWVGAAATLRIDVAALYGGSQSEATQAAIDGAAALPVHGVIARCERRHRAHGLTFYRAELRPRLWHASLDEQNQVYLDKTYPEIIEAELDRLGLRVGTDVKSRLTGSYRSWEFVCQYRESSLAFLHRLMERVGIYYFFEQGESAEVLVLTDHLGGHPDATPDRVRYAPESGLDDGPAVRRLARTRGRAPTSVTLQEYNYRTPSVRLRQSAEVESAGAGARLYWGDHFKTDSEGDTLAAIRAEEAVCWAERYQGGGIAAFLRPGYRCAVHDHPLETPALNQNYLFVAVEHEGAQGSFARTGMGEAARDETEGTARLTYENRFVAIPATTQFRPRRATAWPRVHGRIPGVVDQEGVDAEGRYKIRLPFERGDGGPGGASRWCRLAKPYTGANYGMHFPLHQGTEVQVVYIDGDPDRPIIAGAMENPTTPSQTDDVSVGVLQTATNSFQSFKAPDQTLATPVIAAISSLQGFGAAVDPTGAPAVDPVAASGGAAGEMVVAGMAAVSDARIHDGAARNAKARADDADRADKAKRPDCAGFVGFGAGSDGGSGDGASLARTDTQVAGYGPFARDLTPYEVEVSNVERADVVVAPSLTVRQKHAMADYQDGLTEQTVGAINRYNTGTITSRNIGAVSRTQTGSQSNSQTGDTYKVYVGSYTQTYEGNYTQRMTGDYDKTVIGPSTEDRHGDQNTYTTTMTTVTKTTVGDTYTTNRALAKSTTHGDTTSVQTGNAEKYHLVNSNLIYGGDRVTTLEAASFSFFLGLKANLQLAVVESDLIGGAFKVFAGVQRSYKLAVESKVIIGGKLGINIGIREEHVVGLQLKITLGIILDLKIGPLTAEYKSAGVTKWATFHYRNYNVATKTTGAESTTAASDGDG